MKKIVTIVLVLVLLTIPVTMLAAPKEGIVYTALGDSIAYGTGAMDKPGYVDLLNEHFEKVYGEVKFNKMAENGVTSEVLLLNLMNNPSASFAVSSADIITISIGGNDILQTVIGINPETDLQTLPPQYVMELQLALKTNVTQFAENWANIIGYIRGVNPDAQIIVNTLYNPFKFNEGLYLFADPFIQGINASIIGNSVQNNYQVADVYTKFNEYNNDKKVLVHNTISSVYVHPTDRGYKFIYNLHKDLIGED